MKSVGRFLNNKQARIRELNDLVSRANKDSSAIPIILSALKDRSKEVQLEAENCLTQALKNLTDLPQVGRSHFFGRVAEALEEVEEFAPRAIPIFIDALGDAQYKLQQALQSSLVRIGEPAFPALEEAVRSDNVKLRSAAIKPLSEIGSRERALPLLQQCLKDEDSGVRWVAINGIAGLGSEDLGYLLLEVLGDKVDRVQKNAAKQLAKNISQSTPALVDALNQPDQRVYLGATRALAYCEDQEAVQDFLDTLDSDLRQRVEDQIADWHDKWERVWFHIEDEIGAATLLRIMIERNWERKTRHFPDGIEAMQWIEDLREGRYDGPIPELIISGHMIPGPKGLEVCRELRKIPELSDTPIVMLAAYRFPPEEEPILMETVDRYIQKPVLYNDFITIIDEVFESRRRKISGQVGGGDVS